MINLISIEYKDWESLILILLENGATAKELKELLDSIIQKYETEQKII